MPKIDVQKRVCMHKNDVLKTKESDSSGSRFAAAVYSKELPAYTKEPYCNKRDLCICQKTCVHSITKQVYIYIGLFCYNRALLYKQVALLNTLLLQNAAKSSFHKKTGVLLYIRTSLLYIHRSLLYIRTSLSIARHLTLTLLCDK